MSQVLIIILTHAGLWGISVLKGCTKTEDQSFQSGRSCLQLVIKELICSKLHTAIAMLWATPYAHADDRVISLRCILMSCIAADAWWTLLQTIELQQAEEATMQDGERPHIGRSARHASKVRQIWLIMWFIHMLGDHGVPVCSAPAEAVEGLYSL